ncbi:MAG TPA: alpha/beta hydrolase [Sphingobium sp.]
MHPYYQAIIDAYATAGRPYFHQVTPVEARAMLKTALAAAPPPVGLPELAEVVDEQIEGPHGPIPIRRYAPQGERLGVCVYFHSGGWVIGDLDQADPTCRRLAGATQCEIVSVDYRLAPEHPYPQPLDDAYAALLWTAANRPGPLALIGESAGGNLAAACAIRARDEGGPKIVAQLLAYPVTDHRCNTASYREIGDKNWLLSTADMIWFWNHYCPPHVDRSHPLVSPLQVADVTGLPPTMICVAELDPLREEGAAYGERLAAGGISVTLRRDPGVLHGYWGGAGVVDVSTEALAQASAWIGNELRTAAAAAEPHYGDINAA